MKKFQTWGEMLLYPERLDKGKKGKDPKKVRLSSLSGGGGKSRKSVEYLKARLNGIVKKHPQVMVKITGGNHSFKDMAAHADYIGRNGELPLETENGEIIEGRLKAEELAAMWGDDSLLQEDGQTKFKQNYHIMFSMPEGTDRTAFGVAAREAIYNLFAENHQFIMAEHYDTPHPHIHVCVKAIGHDGTRLRTKKEDLQRWREVFAEQLREHGIEAEATKRAVRGNFKHPMPTGLKKMEQHNEELYKSYQENDKLVKEQKERARVGRPYQESKAVSKAKRTRKQVEKIYGNIISELENGNASDKRLAKDLKNFVGGMQKIQPKAEVVYNQEKKRIERGKSEDITK